MNFLRKYGALGVLFVAITAAAQAPAPDASKATASDLRKRADGIKKQIDDDNRHVLHLQALVRKDKDVIKLTCINDKLIQIKAQTDLFDNANLQLEAGINGEDATLKTSAFNEVSRAGADVKKLRGEADSCAGELEMYKQESRTDVERPPDLEDPTDTGDGFDGTKGPDVDVPGFATPWK